MKRIILATMASSFIALTASATPEFTSGAKLGFGTGFKHHRTSNTLRYDNENVVAIPNGGDAKNSSTSTYNGQLHGGYDWILGRFLVGLEGQYRYSPGKITAQLNPDTPLFVNTPGTNELTQEHRHDFALAVNLGGLVTKNVSLYAIGSVRLGQFKNQYKNNKPGLAFNGIVGINDLSKTQYLWGAGFGVGARWKVSQHFSLGLETTYDIYQDPKIQKDTFVGTSAVTPNAKRPHILNAMVTASWHF